MTDLCTWPSCKCTARDQCKRLGVRADLYTAVCAERDALRSANEGLARVVDDNWVKHQRVVSAEARAEAAEAAIIAALERLDASLFTNAEHQQAKDILRGALKDKT